VSALSTPAVQTKAVWARAEDGTATIVVRDVLALQLNKFGVSPIVCDDDGDFTVADDVGSFDDEVFEFMGCVTWDREPEALLTDEWRRANDVERVQ
jgi:hypothetical protein